VIGEADGEVDGDGVDELTGSLDVVAGVAVGEDDREADMTEEVGAAAAAEEED
jgi:hypothetical protein